MQTPATVFLDNAGIAYEATSYEHDPNVASYGLEAASALGLDPSTVFKTLVARLDDTSQRLVVAIIPVTDRLDLKALARAAGAKRAVMAPVVDAERATGYLAGGISPFAQKRQHATYLDETATICERIHVSAGKRGLELAVAPSDLELSLDAFVTRLTTSER